MSGTIRLLIVEDHNIVRHGLVALLHTVPGMEVVAQAARGEDGVKLFEQHAPDITLMDLRLPGQDGVATIAAIRAKHPEARIIVLTTFDGDENIYRALHAGAAGYLLKGMEIEELVAAIRDVHRGTAKLPRAVRERLAERMPGQELTDRELDVLREIVAGKSNKEISAALFISESTVKTHINSLLGKLGVSDRTQATTTALQRGIVHLD